MKSKLCFINYIYSLSIYLLQFKNDDVTTIYQTTIDNKTILKLKHFENC